MTTNITEVDTYPATLANPNTGELASAPALLSAFLQGSANRQRFVANRLPGVSASIELEVSLTPFFNGGAYLVGTNYDWLQSNVASPGALLFPLPQLPRLTTNPIKISAMRARVLSVTGHSALPANKPSLSLYKKALTTGGTVDPTPSLVATQQNTYGSLSVYEQIHDITTISAGAFPMSLSPGETGFLQFIGESGANSAVNKLYLLGLYVTVTP